MCRRRLMREKEFARRKTIFAINFFLFLKETTPHLVVSVAPFRYSSVRFSCSFPMVPVFVLTFVFFGFQYMNCTCQHMFQLQLMPSHFSDALRVDSILCEAIHSDLKLGEIKTVPSETVTFHNGTQSSPLMLCRPRPQIGQNWP